MRYNAPSDSDKSKTRSLTDEEKQLWQHATRHDTPAAPARHAPVKAKKATKPAAQGAPPANFYDTPVYAHPSPLVRGGYANIDRNTAERFRKGHYPIDATLDLHGMTREKAYIALTGFLKAQYARGSRCLLVVTGKGVRRDAPGEAPRSVLRDALPQWLEIEELRSLVLVFDSAKPKHGGTGAWYILLRRKR